MTILERELDREMPKLFAGDGRYGRICSRFYVLVHALTLVSDVASVTRKKLRHLTIELSLKVQTHA
jgi:hypothetical protein